MITLSEERREEAPEAKQIASSYQPLPAKARRAVAAAAAVERGEVDLEHAARRYGATEALIETWQHALQAMQPDVRGAGGKLRASRH